MKNLFLPQYQDYHLLQSRQNGSVISVMLNKARSKGGVAHVNLGEEERGVQ